MSAVTFQEPRADDTIQRLLYKLAKTTYDALTPPTPPAPACSALSGAGTPVATVTPDFVGQLYHNTVADTYYRSTGLTSADWVSISGGVGSGLLWGPLPETVDSMPLAADTLVNNVVGWFTLSAYNEFSFGNPKFVTVTVDFQNSVNLVSLEMRLLQTVGSALFLTGCSSLTTARFPSLVSVGADLDAANCPALVTLDISSLVSIGALGSGFGLANCTSIVTLDVSSLVTVATDFSASGSSSLANVLCGSWLPNNGTLISFFGCALTTTSVELILRRCVLAGVTTCTIDLSGGTNAGTASLSPQGQADVATLGAQVTMNP